jgi:hypothetical protein
MQTNTDDFTTRNAQDERIAEKVIATLRGLRYGSVTLTVHDARIVQIERLEKSRFDDLFLENGDGI